MAFLGKGDDGPRAIRVLHDEFGIGAKQWPRRASGHPPQRDSVMSRNDVGSSAAGSEASPYSALLWVGTLRKALSRHFLTSCLTEQLKV